LSKKQLFDTEPAEQADNYAYAGAYAAAAAAQGAEQGVETAAAGAAARAFVLVPLLEAHEAQPAAEAAFAPDPAERLEEAIGLAQAIHLDILDAQCIKLARPHPATLFGSGKVAEIAAAIAAQAVNLVIIDHAVTPVQQRNLEKAWQCKVIDRTALILEIFGERARTKEGVLQVELAHLNYQKGRLVRSWTHLERQRGGGGFLGGPGETQIEADRRILQEKILRIKRELTRTVKTRQLHRAKRQKAPYPVIALVGYTNAGKSTLFNRLTGANVMAENMLFATLDPTLRRIRLIPEDEADNAAAGGDAGAGAAAKSEAGPGQMLILSDTVGFISHLPTHLVAAFRATLEEVVEADLILHVRDMANPANAAHKHDVVEILRSLGVDTENPAKIIEVWNKIDLLAAEPRTYLESRAANAALPAVAVSAVSGAGLNALRQLIIAKTLGARQERQLSLAPQELALLDWLYRRGGQSGQHFTASGGVELEASLSDADWRAFAAERRKLRAEKGLPPMPGLETEENSAAEKAAAEAPDPKYSGHLPV